MSEDTDVRLWTKMYESLNEQDLDESTNDEDIINTAFSTLLYFLAGEGNKVLKDEEWIMYLKNDLNTAITKGIFKPSFEDKQHIKIIQHMDEDEEEASDEES